MLDFYMLNDAVHDASRAYHNNPSTITWKILCDANTALTNFMIKNHAIIFANKR